MAKQILILPGDGVGKEVAASAVEVLDYFISEENLNFNIIETEIGGASYEKYGSPLTEETLDIAKNSDTVLFGAVGGPQWDDLEWGLRPEKLF